MIVLQFLDFIGKTILVSGASSGFGRAICLQLSKLGADLILVGRNKERLLETAELLDSDKYYVLQQDLANHTETAATMKSLSKKIGKTGDRLFR